MLNSKIALIE